MFPRNQCSKPTFRKKAERYVAYNALCVIDHDTISCMYRHIQAKLHQICVFSEQTGIIRPQKSGILIFIG